MPVKWTKTWISDEQFEAAGVFDVDNDGVLDIVSGGFWYKGPDFRKKSTICPVAKYDEYYDDFSVIPMDVDGDGKTDFITGGWWGKALRWRKNPGEAGKPWSEFEIAQVGNIETTRAWDVDGDGELEIVPNTPCADDLKILKLENGAFKVHSVFKFPDGAKQEHGLGCGDIAGNGRMDIVLRKGWLEAPEKPFEGKWKWHPDFDLGTASVPILVVDVDGDGRNELIVGSAHGYGLSWLKRDASGKWTTHQIDPFEAQYHDMAWADIDGDGKCELVTGKRHRAHCGNEAGEWDDCGVYYFKWNGDSFTKIVIDHGAVGKVNGVGIHFALADLRGTGRLDLVAPGKGGLHVYFNEGPSR